MKSQGNNILLSIDLPAPMEKYDDFLLRSRNSCCICNVSPISTPQVCIIEHVRSKDGKFSFRRKAQIELLKADSAGCAQVQGLLLPYTDLLMRTGALHSTDAGLGLNNPAPCLCGQNSHIG